MVDYKPCEGNEITTAQDLIDQVNALIDEMVEEEENFGWMS